MADITVCYAIVQHQFKSITLRPEVVTVSPGIPILSLTEEIKKRHLLLDTYDIGQLSIWKLGRPQTQKTILGGKYLAKLKLLDEDPGDIPTGEDDIAWPLTDYAKVSEPFSDSPNNRIVALVELLPFPSALRASYALLVYIN